MACIFYKVPYVFFYEAPAEKTEAFLLVFFRHLVLNICSFMSRIFIYNCRYNRQTSERRG